MSILHRNCAGHVRRDFLQVGTAALGGFGLAPLLQAKAAAKAGGKVAPSDVRCIFVWLDGGPSHYETFDPKPDAPSEIRGEFKTIPTKTPGVHFCDKVPMLAKCQDKFTVIRSIAHRQNNHGAGNHYMTTGRPTPVPVGCGAFVSFHPSLGSVVARSRSAPDGMHSSVALPRVSRSGGPNFLGAKYAPFQISNDPNSGSFRVRDVSIPKDLSEGRSMSRAQLRESLDNLHRIADELAVDPAVSLDQHFERSFQLMASKKAQAAFDIDQEDAKVRDRYGRNPFGQRMLLARRLTEIGVPFVTLNDGGWDHHREIFKAYKGDKMANVDRALSALIEDLEERGQLDNTLVVCLGEFGRTPKVNTRGGRDHWSFAMSVLMAGAGVPKGQIVGATDVKGYYASENVYSPEDFAASIYTKLGVDHTELLQPPAGRPVQVIDKGRLIKELFV